MESKTKLLNTKEVAQALSCSLPTARRIMQREDFPLIRVGNLTNGRRTGGYNSAPVLTHKKSGSTIGLQDFLCAYGRKG